MNEEIMIRRMEGRDAMSVFPLMQEFYDKCLGADQYSQELLWTNIDRCIGSYPHIEGWVITDRVVVQGYAIVSFGYDVVSGTEYIRVEELYVSPPYRRTDPGSAFLKALPDHYPEAKFVSIQAQSRKEEAVYRSCGYIHHSHLLST